MEQQITINVANSPWMSCECGSHFFKSVTMIKKISAWESPSGREEPLPVEIFKCESCDKIPDFFIKRFKISDDIILGKNTENEDVK